jgi:serine/threonine-protein kinase
VPVAISGLAGALLAAAAVWSWAGRAPAPVAPTRTSVMVPANRPIAMGWFPGRSLALSPDGTEIVYVGTNLDVPADDPARTQLQLRPLATLAVRDLPGTAGGRQPFFSPDGRWLGFFTTTGDLKKISLAGGHPVTLVEKINSGGLAFGVWAKDNTIIFGTLTTGLRRVSAEGGAVTDLTTPDAAQGEQFHLMTALTPSSRAVLFSGSTRVAARIDAVMLDSGERRRVIENAGRPVLLGSGHLLFQRDDAILIAPFDAERLTVTGPAVPLPDAVRRDSPGSPFPVAELAASSHGTLAYVPAAEDARALALVRRDGTFEPLGPPPTSFALPRASPDGHAVAFVVPRGRDSEVHVYDRRRGSTTKLTEDSRDEGLAWHPDGRSLAIYSTRKDVSGIFLKTLDGRERLLVPRPAGATIIRNAAWSPDGTQLAYTAQTGLLHDIWVMTLGDTPTTAPWLASAASEHSPAFSPDGRWLAYVSDESGRTEIYVRPYPQGQRLAVSTAGGASPVWRRDGKELFFQGVADSVQKMMAVSVTADGASLRLGKPTPLFDLRVLGPSGAIGQYVVGSNVGPQYDTLPDGRFVMVRGPDPAGIREIVLVQNFLEELRRPPPAK